MSSRCYRIESLIINTFINTKIERKGVGARTGGTRKRSKGGIVSALLFILLFPHSFIELAFVVSHTHVLMFWFSLEGLTKHY